MANFKNVTIIKNANIYFDGNVTSRTVLFESGEKKTLGIMLPGKYEFKTAQKEVMEILAGKLDVKLLGSNIYEEYNGGQSFEVPANSTFKIIVEKTTDYCCSYIKE